MVGRVQGPFTGPEMSLLSNNSETPPCSKVSMINPGSCAKIGLDIDDDMPDSMSSYGSDCEKKLLYQSDSLMD